MGEIISGVTEIISLSLTYSFRELDQLVYLAFFLLHLVCHPFFFLLIDFLDLLDRVHIFDSSSGDSGSPLSLDIE